MKALPRTIIPAAFTARLAERRARQPQLRFRGPVKAWSKVRVVGRLS